MNEDGSAPSVRNNAVQANVFSSAGGEETYRISSTLGVDSVEKFGSYANNDYTSSSSAFANFKRALLDYAVWTATTGQDATSPFRVK
jgi:hypothetical protein